MIYPFFFLNRYSAFSKYVVDPNRFRGALLTNWYALDDVWVRMEDQEKKPHVILCMRHSKVSDEKLLKGDLVAILAALQTRMDVVGLEKQMILPVREIPIAANALY